MNRREAIKVMTAPALATALHGRADPLFGAESTVQPASTRTPALAAYERLRLGCSFHFGLPTFTGDDYDVGAVPATTYNPALLDVRQWISVAHQLGAKYCVLTAKYMSGFCLWNSEGYNYDVRAATRQMLLRHSSPVAKSSAFSPASTTASLTRITKESLTGTQRSRRNISS